MIENMFQLTSSKKKHVQVLFFYGYVQDGDDARENRKLIC